MKKVIILMSIFCTMQIFGFSQNEKFISAMASTLKQYADAKDAESLTAVQAKFERIAEAEKTQWLPYYYAALIKAQMSMRAMGDRDQQADDAITLIEKAEALEKNNSEIVTLKSMCNTAKMIVDPMNRFMEYGGKASQLLEEAKKLDPTNPRPYMLQASSLKNTPEQYGGGCKVAKPLADKAVSLYAAFKPASEIHPNWGKENAEGVAAGCK